MSTILNVGDSPQRDALINKKQYHSYAPYTSSYSNNDEIRIGINSQDLYVIPSESYITIELEVVRKTGADFAAVAGIWSPNYAAYLFSEIRYELNNTEIDRIKNPGVTSGVKNFAVHRDDLGRHTGLPGHFVGKALGERKYTFILPLKFIFGFCEDYNKILLNAKHELILIRNRTDVCAYTATAEAFNIKVTKIQWKIQHVQLSDYAKLSMLKYLEKQRSIDVRYRSWDTYELPQIPQTRRHIWTVKSTTQTSKPRYVFVVFQTNKQRVSINSFEYSHCNITDVRLQMNSEYFPYELIKSDFPNGNAQELYYTFLQIQNSYYNGRGGDNPIPLPYETFLSSPIFGFDCSRTDDAVLNGSVDIRLEINADENIPSNTSAYAIIIYENQFEYSPFKSIVIKST